MFLKKRLNKRRSDIMLSEKEYVLSSFSSCFSRFSDMPLAIYGIGRNTQYIVDHFPDHRIMGLMDEVRTGDIIFGKHVISFEEALDRGVKAIIIIARSSNTKIIYRRISRFTLDNAIEVYDLSGNLLMPVAAKSPDKSFEKYSGINEITLKAKIDQSDVVSFDIFDTLIMRKCIYPRDVFLLIGSDFAKKRAKAEMELYSEGKHPNIYDIYARMGGGYSPQTEIDLETEYMTARDAMVKCLEYAVDIGKKVFLTSDMYLPKEIIARMLDGLSIRVDIENILVSCDYGVSKSDGLFDVLSSLSGSGRILHIGDNYEADIMCAQRCGIDTFQIESAVVMLEDSYGEDLLKYDGSLQNRLLIGKFITQQLNDPFLLGRTNGKFEINSNYDMAYTFIAPLVVRFFGWLVERANTLELDLVLLSSRDGYIIEEIYNLLKDKYVLPPMKYFYVSRAVSVIAGLIDDNDIIHVAQLAFAGTPQEMLKDRFHLSDIEIMKRGANESDEGYILRHKQAILRVAEIERKKYLNYIKTLNIRPGSKVGFFDFISSGTCQKALQNIVDFQLTGLYVAATNYATGYKSGTKIEAMCGVLNVFEKTYNLLENYFFMENVMTSFEPTLCGFDDSGAPKFLPEHRTEASFAALDEIHDAIRDYARQACYADFFLGIQIRL